MCRRSLRTWRFLVLCLAVSCYISVFVAYSARLFYGQHNLAKVELSSLTPMTTVQSMGDQIFEDSYHIVLLDKQCDVEPLIAVFGADKVTSDLLAYHNQMEPRNHKVIILDGSCARLDVPTVHSMIRAFQVTGASLLGVQLKWEDKAKCASFGNVRMVVRKEMTVLPNASYPFQPSGHPSCFHTQDVGPLFVARTDEFVKYSPAVASEKHSETGYVWRKHLVWNYIRLPSSKIVECFHICSPSPLTSSTWHPPFSSNSTARSLMKLYQVTRLQDEFGKIYSGETDTKHVTYPYVNTIDYQSSPQSHSELTYAGVVDWNHYQPSWKWIRLRSSMPSGPVSTWKQSCIQHSRVQLKVKYSRPNQYYNYNQRITHQWYNYKALECPNLVPVVTEVDFTGQIPSTRHIYYIIALADDTARLYRLLKGLSTFSSTRTFSQGHSSVIVSDMGREKVLLSVWKKEMPGLQLEDPVHLPSTNGFSRSIALAAAMKRVQELTKSRKQSNALVFAIDTSVVPDPTLEESLRALVIPNHTVFAPIIFKCNLDNPACEDGLDQPNIDECCRGGAWANFGYGMVGFAAKDYDVVHGYDARWGYKWGAEDVDLIDQFSRANIKIIRRREERFYHMRVHKPDNRYYKEKNDFDRPLPLTPKTEVRDVGQMSVHDLNIFLPPTKWATPCVPWDSMRIHRWEWTYVPLVRANYHVVVFDCMNESEHQWVTFYSVF